MLSAASLEHGRELQECAISPRVRDVVLVEPSVPVLHVEPVAVPRTAARLFAASLEAPWSGCSDSTPESTTAESISRARVEAEVSQKRDLVAAGGSARTVLHLSLELVVVVAAGVRGAGGRGGDMMQLRNFYDSFSQKILGLLVHGTMGWASP